MSKDDDLWIISLGAARRCSTKQHIKVAKRKLQKSIKSAPEVMVKITSFAKDASSVRNHLSYICRNGAVPIYDAYDRDVSEERFAGDISRELSEIKGRKTMNLMLSMPDGTPENGFRESVKNFLSTEFGNYDYHYVFHDDKEHYHSHVVVPMVDRDLKRMNPRKKDIQRWREGFADSLEREGILANAMKCIAKGRYGKNNTHWQEMLRKATLVEHGEAPYKNDPENEKSYFVTVDMKGEKKTYWGVGLEKPMIESGILVGERIKIEKTGEEPVLVSVNRKENGKIIGEEKIETIRNEWRILTGKEIKEKRGIESQEELKQNALTSLKKFHSAMIKMKDIETADLVNKFVGERFQTSFTVFKERSKDKDDRTR